MNYLLEQSFSFCWKLIYLMTCILFRGIINKTIILDIKKSSNLRSAFLLFLQVLWGMDHSFCISVSQNWMINFWILILWLYFSNLTCFEIFWRTRQVVESPWQRRTVCGEYKGLVSLGYCKIEIIVPFF